MVWGFIDAEEEPHEYSFSLDADQILSVVLRTWDDPLVAEVEVFASSGASLGSATVEALEERAGLQASEAGQYLVKVASTSGAGDYELWFILNAAIEQEALGLGSNDSLADAEELSAGFIAPEGFGRFAVVGWIEAGYDEEVPFGEPNGNGEGGNGEETPALDHYRISLAAGDAITAVLQSPSNIAFELLDADEASLARGVRFNDNPSLAVIPAFVAPSTGEYFFRVSSDSWGEEEYTLLVLPGIEFDAMPASAVSEPYSLQSGLTNAQRLQAGTRAVGSLSSAAFHADPAVFEAQTELTNAFPGVTFSVVGIERVVTALETPYGTTRKNVFGHRNTRTWASNNQYLRADFDTPVDSVLVDVVFPSLNQSAYLRAFDSDGNLLGTRYSPFNPPRGTPIPLTLRASGIAAVEVSGWGWHGVYLDNLRTGIDPADAWAFAAEAGDILDVSLAFPFAGGAEPLNHLEASLAVYDAAGSPVIEDPLTLGESDAFRFQAAASGEYTAVVTSTGPAGGEYFLDISGATPAQGSPPTIIETSPLAAQDPPAWLTIVFSEPLSPETPPLSSLVVDGVGPVQDLWFADARTLQASVDLPDTEQAFLFTLAQGAVTDLQGVPNDELTFLFHIDRTPPNLLSHSPAPDAELPFDRIEFLFDEPIDPDSLHLDNVTTFTGPAGNNIHSRLRNISAEGSVVTVSFDLTGHLAPGQYTMVLRDSFKDLAGNEMAGGYYTAEVELNGPDLVVESLDIAGPVYFGEDPVFTWTVRNIGGKDAAGAGMVAFYLSYDATLDGNDLFLGEVVSTAPQPLAPGAMHTQSQRIHIPFDVAYPEGMYYILAVVDSQEEVFELDDANNTLASDPVAIQILDYPNLQVSSVTAPQAAFANQTVLIEWTVINVGTGPTASPFWYDEVYLSPDLHLGDDDDIYLGRAMNGSFLDVGDSYTSQIEATLPRDVHGEYYILVMADAGLADGVDFAAEARLDPITGEVTRFSFGDGQVFELGGEDDNVGASDAVQIDIGPLPDLQVTHVAAPSIAFSGQPMAINWTVGNFGEVPANGIAWVDEVYISEDQTLDDGDVRIGTFQYAQSLAPGETYSVSHQAHLPSGLEGEHHFIVVTNAGDHVFEHWFAENNAGATSTPTHLELTPPPDLAVVSVNYPASALAGEVIEVAVRVGNEGATATPSRWWESIYLSDVPEIGPDPESEGATLLESYYRLGVLEPGETRERVVEVSLPVGIEGDFFLIVHTDSDNSIFEADDENNIAAAPIAIQNIPPDLVVTLHDLTDEVLAGGFVWVEWTTTNIGAGPTATDTWNDTVHASTPPAGQLASFSRRGVLAPGESYTRREMVSIPVSYEGAYEVVVATDFSATGRGNVYEGDNEDNNVSEPLPLWVNSQASDLALLDFEAPVSADAGDIIELTWQVANLGPGVTNSEYWYDVAYLSEDAVLDEGDIPLRLSGASALIPPGVRRSGSLESGATYSATRHFVLPSNASGNYYLLFVVDAQGHVRETEEANNVAAKSISIAPVPPPNLAVGYVSVPAQMHSGLNAQIAWTVNNLGEDAQGAWWDSVYLSRDMALNPREALYLGTFQMTGGLGRDDSYTRTESIRIPAGIAGNYYVIVATDVRGDLDEHRQTENNVGVSPQTTRVVAPPPIDLVAGTITIPVGAVPGEEMEIVYRVDNAGDETAPGGWYDALYISADRVWDLDDPFFARVLQDESLPAQGYYETRVVAPMPGVAPGEYYLLVRTDILNQILETDELNNFSASVESFSVDVPLLELGEPAQFSIASGQSAFYRLSVPAGETVLVSLASETPEAHNEVFVSFGKPPTRARHDYRLMEPFAPDTRVLVPLTEEGEYYVLVYAAQTGDEAADCTLVANVLSFESIDETYGAGGTAGDFTIQINGAMFDRTVTARLVGGGDAEVAAKAVYPVSPTRFYATFDLTGVAPGIYDVLIENAAGESHTVLQSLTVVEGGGADARGSVWAPRSVRMLSTYNVDFVYGNYGLNDAPAPLFYISAMGGDIPKLSFNTNMDTYLRSNIFIGGSAGDAPFGVLAPGDFQILRMYGQAGATDNPIFPSVNQFTIGRYFQEEGEPVEWAPWREFVLEHVAPAALSDELFDDVFAQIMLQVGDTEGDFRLMLARNATLWPVERGRPSDPANALAVEFEKALAALTTSISGKGYSPDFAVNLSGRDVFATNQNNGRIYRTTSYTDGSFVLANLSPGTYDLSFGGAVVASGGTVSVADGQAVQDVWLDLVPGGTLVGRVQGAQDGQPIEGATVRLMGQDGTLYTAMETTAEGDFLFKALQSGDYFVEVEARGMGWAREAVLGISEGTKSAITIGLELEGAISLVVQAPDEGPEIESLNLGAWLLTGENAGRGFAVASTEDEVLLAGLPAGVFSVTLGVPGYLPAYFAEVEVRSGETAELGAAVLQLPSSIAGRVSAQGTGIALENATVIALADGFVAAAQTDMLGDFSLEELPPGTYTLWATNFGTGISAEVEVAVGVWERFEDVSIEVLKGGTLTGLVVDQGDGLPVPGVEVAVWTPNGASASTWTDTEGRYRFEGLPLGEHTVALTTNGVSGRATANVEVLDGTEIEADLDFASAARLGGIASTSSGAPLVGAVVELREEGRVVLETRTGDGGRYDFRLLRGGTFDLVAYLDTPDATASFDAVRGLVVGEGQSVEQDMQAGEGELQVTVIPAGGGAQGTLVFLSRADGDALVSAGTRVADETGTVVFANLAQGEYRIHALGAGAGRGSTTVELAHAQAAEVNLELVQGFVVTGVVADEFGAPVGGARVLLLKAGAAEGLAATVADANGVYSLSRVPPGVGDLVVFADGHESSVLEGVEVSGDLVLDIALAQSDAELVGTVVGSGGAPISGGAVAVRDGLGRLLGTALIGPDGSFRLRGVAGTGLSVDVDIHGSPGLRLEGVEVPADSLTDLGQISVEPLALAHVPVEAVQGGVGSMAGVKSIISPNRAPSTPSWFEGLFSDKKRLPTEVQLHNLPMGPADCLDRHYIEHWEAVNAVYQQWIAWYTVEIWDNLIDQMKMLAIGTLFAERAHVAGQVAQAALGFTGIAAASVPIQAAFHVGKLGESLYGMVSSLAGMNDAAEAQDGVDYTNQTAQHLNNSKSFVDATLSIVDWVANNPATAPALSAGLFNLAGQLLDIKNLVNSITWGGFRDAISSLRSLQYSVDHAYQVYEQRIEEAQAHYDSFWALIINCAQGRDVKLAKPRPDDMVRPSTIGALDPNDIIGPEGYGPENWIPANMPLSYRIRFENDPEFATAPAYLVRIDQQLDRDLDWRTFRLGDMGFGDTRIPVPDNAAFYINRLDFTDTLGIWLDVAAGIDVFTGRAFWQFMAIDPATGEVPVDPSRGFLPVNAESPEGEGFATYTVRPKATARTGDVIEAQASIVFDRNEPIETPPIFNTLDAEAPTSGVAPLPDTTESERFTVSWGASDDPEGSAVGGVTVYVSRSGEPFAVWIPDTQAKEALFIGEAGNTYAFYSVARDNAGNVEVASGVADASIQVLNGEAVGSMFDLDGDGFIGADDYAIFSAAWRSRPGDLHWNPACDFTDDGFVGVADYAFFTAAYGKGANDPDIVLPPLGASQQKAAGSGADTLASQSRNGGADADGGSFLPANGAGTANQTFGSPTSGGGALSAAGAPRSVWPTQGAWKPFRFEYASGGLAAAQREVLPMRWRATESPRASILFSERSQPLFRAGRLRLEKGAGDLEPGVSPEILDSIPT